MLLALAGPAVGVLMVNVVVIDGPGRVRTFSTERLTPAGQITSITSPGEATRPVTTPRVYTPSVLAASECADRESVADGLRFVTPATLALASVAVTALLAACIVSVLADAAGDGGGNGRRTRPQVGSRRYAAATMAALFLALFSTKLLVMRQNPVTVPYWDQWDGEARTLYLPFGECRLSWIQMFALHNEHRFFFSRLLALDLLMANGQWDPRLQQVVNAALHSLFAILLVGVLWIAQDRRRLGFLVLIAAATFALPFAWENTLLGFQSGFYFLLLFSVLGLWLTTRYGAGTRQWMLGWLCALCALFTGAGGLLLPVAIVGVSALKQASDWRAWRESFFTLGAAGAIVALGLLIASPPLPYHEVLRARNLPDFAGALGRNMAWPFVAHPQLSVVMWLPTGVLLVLTLRRSRTTVLERFIIGLGFWVALQAAAIAYGRGAGAPVPASRYQDFLSLGLVANAVAGVACLDRLRAGTIASRMAMAALVGWLLVPAVGLYQLVAEARVSMSVWRQYWSAHASSVRRFVIVGDLVEFTSKRPVEELPYPDARILAALLQEPYLRRILPAAAREPVRVEPRAGTEHGFEPDGSHPTTPRDPILRAWGSYANRGTLATGRFESHGIESCQSGSKLQFDVAGLLGERGLSLAVRDLRSGREQEVKVPKLTGGEWTSALVSCPAGPYAIIAVDATSDHWFSFREPVEVGRSSPAVEWLIDLSPGMLVAVLVLGTLAAGAHDARRRSRKVRGPHLE
jgi:hypothetical protein